MNIIIEEIVTNPLIQIEETIQEITITVSEMQMPGKSAYQSALDGGFIGTELEFNESLADVLPHISNLENPHQVTKTQVGLGNVDNTSDVNKPISIAQQSALDNKVDKVVGERLINADEIIKLSNQSGVNTGDETASTIINKIGDGSKINQSYLPSYVDDILEFDTVALFPAIGEIGKIYIVITGTDINKQYRWTGSIYTQITNGLIASTNDVPEGVNNLYFTTARVLAPLLSGVSLVTGGVISATDSILSALGKLQKQVSDNLTALGLKQNTLTIPTTGVGSDLDPVTYALQDGTILYHSTKWFVPTGTVSTSGTTVTSVGTQFTSAMVGAKLTINGEWRIITAFTNSSTVTVSSEYSINYSGVVAGSWGVYSRAYEIKSNGDIFWYSILGVSISMTNLTGVSPQFNLITNQSVLISGGNAGFVSDNFGFYDTGTVFYNNYNFRWSSTTSKFGTKDLGLRRNAAGVIEIYDGITATGLEANRRDLLARNVTASQFKLNALNTAPASATATGVLGEIRYDANYMYVCVATNTWKRSALTTW